MGAFFRMPLGITFEAERGKGGGWGGSWIISTLSMVVQVRRAEKHVLHAVHPDVAQLSDLRSSQCHPHPLVRT